MNSQPLHKSFVVRFRKFLFIGVLFAAFCPIPKVSASDVFWVASILVSSELPEKISPELRAFHTVLADAFPDQKITLLEVKKKSAIPGESRSFSLIENATLEIAYPLRFPTYYSAEIRFHLNRNSGFVATVELSKKMPLLIRGAPLENGRLFYLLGIR